METIFVSLICIVLMVIGGMTMSQGFLHSVDNTSNNYQVLSQRDQDILRTNVSILSTTQGTSDSLEVSLRNDGHTKLTNFDRWDIIVFYHDASNNNHATYLSYTSSDLGNNQWKLVGIYVDASALSPEIFDPGILDPDEEMIIQCQLNPPAGLNTTNLISISTPNGVKATKTFTGYCP